MRNSLIAKKSLLYVVVITMIVSYGYNHNYSENTIKRATSAVLCH